MFLFESDEEDISIPSLILDSLLKCAPDARLELAQNLLLVGGICMIPGFKTRLLQEIDLLLSLNKTYSELSGLKGQFKYIDNKYPPNILSWIGASIAGAIENSLTVTREAYEKKEKVIPDWTSLKQLSWHNY